MHNLTSFLAYHARLRPEADALSFGGRRISRGELHDRALRMAGWLAGRGIGPGAVVALVMKNSPAFLETAFAASHLGAVLLPMNYRLAAAEIAWIHGHAGVDLVLADEEFSQSVKGLPNVVLLGSEAQADSRALPGRASSRRLRSRAARTTCTGSSTPPARRTGPRALCTATPTPTGNAPTRRWRSA